MSANGPRYLVEGSWSRQDKGANLKTDKFKYDVAVSFLQEDERLAIDIADRLADRIGVDVFVYSKRQDDLVGRDGLEAFSGVFGDQSRVVVILHREGWGQTPWTRVEETAIKNRGLEQGWDFVLLVKLDPTAAIPKWLPKTRIWLGFDKYGIDGTASAIEALVQQAGGIVRAESAVDYAGRVARSINFEQERRGWYCSQKGVEQAIAAGKVAVGELSRLANEILSRHPELEVRVEHASESCAVRCGGHSVVIGWNRGSYVNSVEGTYLFAKLFRGLVSQHARFFPGEEPKEIEVVRYDPDIDRTFEPGWRDREGEKKFFTSAQLAERWLRRLLEMREPKIKS